MYENMNIMKIWKLSECQKADLCWSTVDEYTNKRRYNKVDRGTERAHETGDYPCMAGHDIEMGDHSATVLHTTEGCSCNQDGKSTEVMRAIHEDQRCYHRWRNDAT